MPPAGCAGAVYTGRGPVCGMITRRGAGPGGGAGAASGAAATGSGADVSTAGGAAGAITGAGVCACAATGAAAAGGAATGACTAAAGGDVAGACAPGAAGAATTGGRATTTVPAGGRLAIAGAGCPGRAPPGAFSRCPPAGTMICGAVRANGTMRRGAGAPFDAREAPGVLAGAAATAACAPGTGLAARVLGAGAGERS
jgi:hypothetical protein